MTSPGFYDKILSRSKMMAKKTKNEKKMAAMEKFHSTDALLEAYVCLESNYTQKCQQLANLKKQVENKETISCEEKIIEKTGYSRTKVLACKPKEFEK